VGGAVTRGPVESTHGTFNTHGRQRVVTKNSQGCEFTCCAVNTSVLCCAQVWLKCGICSQTYKIEIITNSGLQSLTIYVRLVKVNLLWKRTPDCKLVSFVMYHECGE
jgi:hypothetical protein